MICQNRLRLHLFLFPVQEHLRKAVFFLCFLYRPPVQFSLIERPVVFAGRILQRHGDRLCFFILFAGFDPDRIFFMLSVVVGHCLVNGLFQLPEIIPGFVKGFHRHGRHFAFSIYGNRALIRPGAAAGEKHDGYAGQKRYVFFHNICLLSLSLS